MKGFEHGVDRPGSDRLKDRQTLRRPHEDLGVPLVNQVGQELRVGRVGEYGQEMRGDHAVDLLIQEAVKRQFLAGATQFALVGATGLQFHDAGSTVGHPEHGVNQTDENHVIGVCTNDPFLLTNVFGVIRDLVLDFHLHDFQTIPSLGDCSENVGEGRHTNVALDLVFGGRPVHVEVEHVVACDIR